MTPWNNYHFFVRKLLDLVKFLTYTKRRLLNFICLYFLILIRLNFYILFGFHFYVVLSLSTFFLKLNLRSFLYESVIRFCSFFHSEFGSRILFLHQVVLSFSIWINLLPVFMCLSFFPNYSWPYQSVILSLLFLFLCQSVVLFVCIFSFLHSQLETLSKSTCSFFSFFILIYFSFSFLIYTLCRFFIFMSKAIFLFRIFLTLPFHFLKNIYLNFLFISWTLFFMVLFILSSFAYYSDCFFSFSFHSIYIFQ